MLMCILFAVLLVQSADQTEPELFNRLLKEQDQTNKIRLIEDFSEKYPRSILLDEAFTLAMSIFVERGDTAGVLAYGERAIRANSDAIDALVNLSRQYAVEGRNLKRALEYARRAIEVVGRDMNKAPPSGYRVAEWKRYLEEMKATAEGTVKYIEMMTNTVLRPKKGPGRGGDLNDIFVRHQ